MIETKEYKISEIKTNPNNPRIIRDDKFTKLVESIKSFPQMLEIRPIVVNDEMVVLGGNMRLKACIEAGIKKIPVIKASSLTPEQQKEFIIKDNVGYGEWDWDMIANEWDAEILTDWGLEVWNPDDSLLDFEENDNDLEQSSSQAKGTDDGFSVFELIMEHQNKLVLIETINKVKIEFGFDKMEDALMEIIRVYNK